MSAYPLFDAHPRLGELPRAGLLAAATPVSPLADSDGVYIKRDDLSAADFGGNKIRKLDLLLGEALAQQRRSLVCFGYSGSNFVAASAWHGRKLGLDTYGFLLPQADAPYLADNLAVSRHARAHIDVAGSSAALVGLAIMRSAQALLARGRLPYWMPPGGSTPLGAVGFVNAAFELHAQIEAGLLPSPRRIYIAFSSMGSVAGLALGLALAGIDTRIVAVQVVDDHFANQAKLDALIGKTQRLLLRYHARLATTAAPVEIRREYFGQEYAVPTAATKAAMQRFVTASGARADSAYTGKALCSLYDDIDRGLAEPILYWHTFNAQVRPDGIPALPASDDRLRRAVAR